MQPDPSQTKSKVASLKSSRNRAAGPLGSRRASSPAAARERNLPATPREGLSVQSPWCIRLAEGNPYFSRPSPRPGSLHTELCRWRGDVPMGRKPMRWRRADGLMIILLLCGCQSGAQLPPTPVIGATCLTLSGSCLILTSPPAGSPCSCPGLGNGTVTGTSGL